MDYSKYTDEELNEVIARMKYGIVEMRHISTPETPLHPYWKPEGGAPWSWNSCPHWSTSIADAWQLEDEINAAGLLSSVWYSGVNWFCVIRSKISGIGDVIARRNSYTATRAICLAWLAWKQATK